MVGLTSSWLTYFHAGPMRGAVQPVHRSGPRYPENQYGVCESLKGSIALIIDVLFWILLLIGLRYMYIQLFLVYWLCKIHWDFWILVVDHHSHLHCGFIWPQILNFERSVSLSPGNQSSLVPPCKISLGGPVCMHCII